MNVRANISATLSDAHYGITVEPLKGRVSALRNGTRPPASACAWHARVARRVKWENPGENAM